jgi:sec-independent protein translocase protein TatC
MPKTRDLFDDSVMSFGEHLDVLRVHLVRAMFGLVIGVSLSLFLGEQIVTFIRQPIDAALKRANLVENITEDVKGFDFFGYVGSFFAPAAKPAAAQAAEAASDPVNANQTSTTASQAGTIVIDKTQSVLIELEASQLATELHRVAPTVYPPAPASLAGQTIRLEARSSTFSILRKAAENASKPVALKVEEAFMTYLKVGFFGGLILSSPWIFYQLWLFVAAGLYPHERKYVYIFLPMSIVLFLAGAFFCYYAVFPYVLDFLLGFNIRMGIAAQIRISEWITFAVTLPVMFGISFQLPLIMLFLERINVFTVDIYFKQQRMAIFVLAIASVILTPSQDPFSMLLMLGPLVTLYYFGILLCKQMRKTPPATIAS